jgi:hypothetical protein
MNCRQISLLKTLGAFFVVGPPIYGFVLGLLMVISPVLYGEKLDAVGLLIFPLINTFATTLIFWVKPFVDNAGDVRSVIAPTFLAGALY